MKTTQDHETIVTGALRTAAERYRLDAHDVRASSKLLHDQFARQADDCLKLLVLIEEEGLSVLEYDPEDDDVIDYTDSRVAQAMGCAP